MVNTEDNVEEFYEKYNKLIYKVAYDMTKDYHLAEDICQETFAKLCGYPGCINEKRAKSWLIVVAANLIRDHYRKGGKYKEVLDSGELADLSVQGNGVDVYLKELGIKDLQNRMLEGLRKKNPAWYEVLILVEYLEIPRKAVAKKYGIALSTVDSYLKKSKRWLSSHYKEEYEEL